MDPLFVRVDFDDGGQRVYAIFGRMSVVDFRTAIAARHAQSIKNVTFLHEPGELPAVAELLPIE